MSFDYSAAKETAKSIIANFGSANTVTKKGIDGGYDQDGNVIANQPDITINGTMTPLLQFKNSEIDGKNIISGDGYVFFDTDSLIEVGYVTTINGKNYRVVDVSKITSINDVTVYQKLQLRG